MQPKTLNDELEYYHDIDPTVPCSLPYCENSVQAGMPVSRISDEHLSLNLGELLNIHADHFCTRVRGDSMEGACIHSGDLLIARKCNQAEEGQIVIAEIDNESTVKQYHYDEERHRVVLRPCNPNYHPIEVQPTQTFLILGIVERVIKQIA
ncbi:MAG: hypothetical protein J6X31_05950 [Bacteroidales bacterium]|nr:hypothetical protein [Bacteroidales bacterium]